LGGGDNAFENYLFVRGRGARQVTIFARSLKARADFLRQVPAEDIWIGNYAVDAKRRRVNGKRFDKLIVLYGWEAHLPYMAEIPVALNERGFVMTGTDCETSQRDVFAIGEVAQRAHPCCITSMADGVAAAKAIQERLEQGALARFVSMTKRAAGMAAFPSISRRRIGPQLLETLWRQIKHTNPRLQAAFAVFFGLSFRVKSFLLRLALFR
jgi:hypothetical protein